MKSRRYTQLVIQLVLLYLFTFFSCPETSIISPFVYDKENGRAEAKLYSMFKFPDSNRVHFQCDILVCKGRWWYNNNEKIFKFHEKNDQIVFSVNIKKKGSIHSFFFREMWKKRIDRNQVHFQFDILVCTGTWYYDGNDIFLCRITLMYICEEKKLLMYRKILFAIFEMIHSFMTMNLCNNFSVGAHSGLQKKSNTV